MDASPTGITVSISLTTIIPCRVVKNVVYIAASAVSFDCRQFCTSKQRLNVPRTVLLSGTLKDHNELYTQLK